ncbi:MAG: oxidoreductase [Verrucomicrobiales bacterium]|nr:oxidoreductase [Verrucomicrobiales bacterium]|tara:strand:+ start:4723 stop:6003 length:1281 start_codon:yes stop_codon:yes gene_type:complete
MTEHKLDRRQFIHASGGAAVASGLIAPTILAKQLSTQTLKVGLVGCGGRGTGAAYNALMADENVVVSAMADTFPEQMEKSLAQLRKQLPDRVKVDSKHRFVGLDAYRELMQADVDIVILATPPAFRPAHLEAAVEAGKHSFVEITAAIDSPGVRSVLASSELAERKRLAIVSGFCWRYDPSLQAAVEQIRNGAIGEIRSLYATYLRPNLGPKYKGDRKPNMSDVEWQIRDWYHHLWLAGDLTILLSGGHSVDKMSWWMNDEMPINAVAIGGQQNPRWGNTFDNAFVTYEYANGIRGYLASRSINGCYDENGDEVVGTNGIFKFQQRRPVITGETNWRYKGPTRSMHQVELDALIGSIRSGKPINDGKRMARTTLMGILGRMAAYTGKKVSWEAAMQSTQALLPDGLALNSTVTDQPLAMPGTTRFL